MGSIYEICQFIIFKLCFPYVHNQIYKFKIFDTNVEPKKYVTGRNKYEIDFFFGWQVQCTWYTELKTVKTPFDLFFLISLAESKKKSI